MSEKLNCFTSVCEYTDIALHDKTIKIHKTGHIKFLNNVKTT